MARLPTRDVLGGLPGRPSRQIASIAVPAGEPVSQGMVNLGKGLSSLGASFSDINEKQEKLAAAQVDADLTIALNKLYLEQTQNPDYANAPTMFRQRAGDAARQIFEGSSLPAEKKALLFEKSRIDVERYNFALGKHAVERGHQTTLYNDSQRADQLTMSALGKSPEEQAVALQQADNIFKAHFDAGITNASQYAAARKAHVDKFAEAYTQFRIKGAKTDDELKSIEGDLKKLKDALPKIGPQSSLEPGAIVDQTAKMGVNYAWGKMPEVKGIVWHHTAGTGGVEGVIATLKQRNLGAQYVIDRDGTVHQLMPDDAVGRHARSGGTVDNSNSIGIEVVARNDQDILPVQVETAKRLAATLGQRHGFDPAQASYGHGQVNPGRKEASEGMTIVNAIRGSTLDGDKSQPAAGQTLEMSAQKKEPITGTGMDFLTMQGILKAEGLITQERRARFVDAERLRKQQEHQAKLLSDEESVRVVQDTYAGRPPSARDVLYNEKILPDKRHKLIEVMDAIIKNEYTGPAGVNAIQYLEDMRRRVDDPRRLNDGVVLDDALVDRKIDKDTHSFLHDQLKRRDEPLQKLKGEFLKGISPKIDKSNPVMGQIDFRGRENLFRFEQDVERLVEEDKKAGKDPKELFDQRSKRYIGQDNFMKFYMTTMDSSMEEMTQRMKALPRTGVAVETSGPQVPEPGGLLKEVTGESANFRERFLVPSPPAKSEKLRQGLQKQINPMRLPGETIEQYKKRMGM